jgi:hypothetical protein
MAEIGELNPVESLGKIEKAVRRGQTEDAERAGYRQSFVPGRYYTLPVVHQEQIGMKLDCQNYGVSFTRVKILEGSIVGWAGLANFHPRRRCRNPASDQGWCLWLGELISNHGQQDHFGKERRKNIDMSDQDQIVDRPGIGDDDLHPSKP